MFFALGQFGLVYKGDWFINVAGKPTIVAVKTLKGEQKFIDFTVYINLLIHCNICFPFLRKNIYAQKHFIQVTIVKIRLKHF